jgi:hypothetical protein
MLYSGANTSFLREFWRFFLLHLHSGMNSLAAFSAHAMHLTPYITPPFLHCSRRAGFVVFFLTFQRWPKTGTPRPSIYLSMTNNKGDHLLHEALA